MCASLALQVFKVDSFINSHSQDSRERRIQELTMELQRQDRLCELYRELLLSFLENVKEQTKTFVKKSSGCSQ